MNKHTLLATYLFLMTCLHAPAIAAMGNIPAVPQVQHVQQKTTPHSLSFKERMTEKLASCKNYIKNHSRHVIAATVTGMAVLALSVTAYKNNERDNKIAKYRALNAARAAAIAQQQALQTRLNQVAEMQARNAALAAELARAKAIVAFVDRAEAMATAFDNAVAAEAERIRNGRQI